MISVLVIYPINIYLYSVYFYFKSVATQSPKIFIVLSARSAANGRHHLSVPSLHELLWSFLFLQSSSLRNCTLIGSIGICSTMFASFFLIYSKSEPLSVVFCMRERQVLSPSVLHRSLCREILGFLLLVGRNVNGEKKM